MSIFYLLARVCGLLLIPTTLLVLLGSAATVYALQLIGTALTLDELQSTPIGLLFTLACALLIITRIASRMLLDWLAMRAISRIRYNLTQKLLDLPLERIEVLGSPKIMAMIFDDIVRIGAGLSGLPAMIGNVIVLAGAFVYLGFISVIGLAALLAMLVFGIFFYRWLLYRASIVQRKAREVRDQLYDLTGGMVSGVKELTLNRARRRFMFDSIFDNLLKDHFRHSYHGAILSTTGLTVSQILYFLCLGVVVFIVPQFVDVDRDVLTKFAVVVLYLPTPIEGIVIFLSTLTMAQVSIERLDKLDVLGKDLHLRKVLPAEQPHGTVQSIQLTAVSYAYTSGAASHGFVVGPVDLNFTPGEVVFFVGGNGSGKTTLAKVLSGLYRPTTGKVFINGHQIQEDQHSWYSQHFSAIFNEFHVFKDYPRAQNDQLESSENEEMKAVLNKLGIEHVVSLENGSVSTIAGLSTGQKKRLALLVSLLEDKPVYIFDEWAADQDPGFRNTFYHEILPELARRNKIVIVITHDDDYFNTADRVVTFKYGKLDSDLNLNLAQPHAQLDTN